MRIIIFDDDPTGIQTVHGCLVVTEWDTPTLKTAFKDECPFFYVFTNTRAYNQTQARKIVAEAFQRILEANREFHDHLILISRSDSTLRSHFPLEIKLIADALENEQGRPVDAIFLVPAFFEGGRVTKEDTHYIAAGEQLIPTSDTEFAKDAVFGYTSSHLPTYIEEKTGGQVRTQEVRSISLRDLRASDDAKLSDFLQHLRKRTYVVVNAENYADLHRFSTLIRSLVAAGKSFVFQSAASFVKSLTGTSDKPLLGKEILSKPGIGIFVIGSYVQKTSLQLQQLLGSPLIQPIEINLDSLLKSGKNLMPEILTKIQAVVREGKTPVVYTSRQEITFGSAEQRLEAGQAISGFLSELVKRLPFQPAYIVAKGGITSHDILVQGLSVSTARVLGQILPGVPVIALPKHHQFGAIPYVIFPGNVGDEYALRTVFQTLR